MISLKFPHFTRKISARVWLPSVKPFLWLALFALISANLWAKASFPPRFLSQALAALKNPDSFALHIDLAQAYWQQCFWPPAQRELLLAEELWQKRSLVSGNSLVLGATTSPVALLELWQDEPKRLGEAYVFWQNVAERTPDYRDAYTQLGAAAYQLGKLNEAKSAWEKALVLDPNSSLLPNLLSLIK